MSGGLYGDRRAVEATRILATGTPSVTTYLRGDGAWAGVTAAPPDLTAQTRTPGSSQTVTADSCVVMQGNLSLTAGLSLTMGAGACLKILT